MNFYFATFSLVSRSGQIIRIATNIF